MPKLGKEKDPFAPDTVEVEVDPFAQATEPKEVDPFTASAPQEPAELSPFEEVYSRALEPGIALATAGTVLGVPEPVKELLNQVSAGFTDEATLGLLPIIANQATGGTYGEELTPEGLGERTARKVGEFTGFVAGAPVKLGTKAVGKVFASEAGQKVFNTMTKRLGEKWGPRLMGWMQEGAGLGVASAITDIDGLADAYADERMNGITDLVENRLDALAHGAATGARFGIFRDVVKHYGTRALANLIVGNGITLATAEGPVAAEDLVFNSMLDLWFSRNKGKQLQPADREAFMKDAETVARHMDNLPIKDMIAEVVSEHRPADVSKITRNPQRLVREQNIKDLEAAEKKSNEQVEKLEQLKKVQAEEAEYETVVKKPSEEFVDWAASVTDAELVKARQYFVERVNERRGTKDADEFAKLAFDLQAISRLNQSLTEAPWLEGQASSFSARQAILEKRGTPQGDIVHPNTVDIFRDKLTQSTIALSPQEQVVSQMTENFSDPKIRTQDFLEHEKQRHEKLNDYSTKYRKAVGAIFDVELPFKKVAIWRDPKTGSVEYKAAEETGYNMKNLHSTEVAIQKEGLKVLEDISKKLNFNDDMMRKLVLFNETKEFHSELTGRERVDLIAPSKMMEEAFLGAKAKLKELGVIDAGFKEATIEKLQTRLTEEADPIKRAKIQKNIKVVEEMNFVHIPTNIWFERLSQVNTEKMDKVLSFLTAKKRKTLRIYDLYKNGVLKLEDIHTRDVLSSYFSRMGRDIAIAKIIQSAKKEGLAVDAKNKNPRYAGYGRPYNAPTFKGVRVHPLLNKWIQDTTGVRYSRNIVARGLRNTLSFVKMAAFYNPLFLPFYDTVQGTMARSWWAPGIPKMKYFRRALKDYKENSAEWMLAEEYGIASQPYANPYDNYAKQMNRIIDPGLKVLQSKPLSNEIYKLTRDFAKHLLNPKKGFGVPDIYNASWETAWTLDRFVRQTTYRYFREKGMTVKEAAQTAAMFHGDYASVPARTREMANKIFFTPTFKVAMSKLYYNMLKDASKLMTGRANEPANKRYAYGLASTTAVVLGWDLFMQGLGFKRDQFGVKYVKDVMTEEGPKEFVLHMSNPANLAIKYFQKIQRILKVDDKSIVGKAVREFQTELHPVYQIVIGLKENKDKEGEPIYNIFDGDAEKIVKQAWYVLNEAIPILKLPYVSKNETQIQKYANETLGLFEVVTRPFTYRYLRTPKYIKIAREIERVQKTLEREVKEGRFGPEGVEVLRDHLLELQDELTEELEK